MNKKILLIAATTLILTQVPLKAEQSNNASFKSFADAFEPPMRDKPSVTSGGASRGDKCLLEVEQSQVPLTPILPAIEQRLTVASHPTFFINLPLTSAKQVFFRIEDHNQDYEYTTILPITGKEGIIRVTLPPDAPPLEIKEEYQWFLAIMCQGRLKPDSPMVQGSVTRVPTTIASSEQFTTMTQLQQAETYAQAGIWYETLSLLAQLREQKPQDSNLLSIWEKVLTSVGLENLAEAELVD